MDAMQRSHGARALRGLGLLFGLLMLGGCEAGQPGTSSSPTVAARRRLSNRRNHACG